MALRGRLSVMPGAETRSKTRKRAGQTAKKMVGRPRAKHSSPDYTQVSLYLHKDVRNKVKVRLFEQGAEFSGLVESLLKRWLEKGTQ